MQRLTTCIHNVVQNVSHTLYVWPEAPFLPDTGDLPAPQHPKLNLDLDLQTNKHFRGDFNRHLPHYDAPFTAPSSKKSLLKRRLTPTGIRGHYLAESTSVICSISCRYLEGVIYVAMCLREKYVCDPSTSFRLSHK